MTVRVRIMTDILEMHLLLHLSNSHLKKNIYHLELGQEKDILKENQSEGFFFHSFKF